MSDEAQLEAASPEGVLGTPAVSVPPAAHSPSRRRRVWRWVTVALVGAAVTAAVVPVVMVSIGLRRARACFAAVEAPRGAALPDCGGEMRWYIWPSYVPWTSWDARYQAEELWVRMAATDYVDAAVGKADRAALAAAADGALEAATRLRIGSKRLALDQLGPAMGAPDPGRLADDLGDRRTLLARAHEHDEWQLRLHTLDAALTEGDLAKATELAKRYAALDPRDDDLRTQVAAVLCLGDDPRRARHGAARPRLQAPRGHVARLGRRARAHRGLRRPRRVPAAGATDDR